MIFPEYLETVFYGPTPPSGWPSDFHIVTAFNPKRTLSEPENHAADTRLRTQLEQEQIAHFRITGYSADLVHQESSWGVVGISLEQAIDIGRQYVQHAIFEVRDGEAFVVSCDTLERRSLGRFQERVKLPSSAVRDSPETPGTSTHRFTFRPFPENPQEKNPAPKEAPPTLEALEARIKGLSLQERVDAVCEFYRAKPSLLDGLDADEAADLVGIEFLDDPDKEHRWDFVDLPEDTDFFEYHEASLTLKASNGGKIVFSTKYNDVENQRFVSFRRY